MAATAATSGTSGSAKGQAVTDEEALRAAKTRLKLKEMVAHCDHIMAWLGDNAEVSYQIKGEWPASNHKRLFGRHGGPFGEVVDNTLRPGCCTCLFKAGEVKTAAEMMLARLAKEVGE